MSKELMEWVHYESWKADRKILAIGDSIVWGAHKYLENVFTGEFGLTTVVCAHGVNEPQFFKSVSMLATLNDAEYEAVYFNNGLHPRGQSADEYAENYEATLLALMKAIPAKKWILGLSTPISSMQTDTWDNTAPITQSKIELLKDLNDLVLEYNEKVVAIAKKLDLPYYDAYALMQGKDDLKIDPYHYTPEGRKQIAEGIAACILAEIQSI